MGVVPYIRRPENCAEDSYSTLETKHASAGTAVDMPGLKTSAAHSGPDWLSYQHVKDFLAVCHSRAATLGDQRSNQFILIS